MNLSNPAVILIGIALIVFLIGRQFVAQPVNEGRLWLVPLALTVYGVYLISQTPPGGLLEIALLMVNVVVAGVLGVARGMSMRVWRDAAGRLLQQGTLVTFGLWLVLLVVRVGLGVLFPGAVAFSQLPLFIGVTLGAQAIVMLARLERAGLRNPASPFEAVR
jgi:hypothetical protein